MKKQKYYFECDNCGYTDINKFFICPECKSGTGKKKEKPYNIKTYSEKEIKYINDIKNETLETISTDIKELDKVLGGKGIVKNSLNIISGFPGVGKSTLLLQLINNFSLKYKCAYITAEETEQQIYQRYKRLKLNNNFYIKHETNINYIKAITKNCDIIIIDSINTIYDDNLNNNFIAGSISQIKNNIFNLMEYAKKNNKTIIIVGQITKDGSIAGPKILEHMVDGVLFFDYFGNNRKYRILKTIKNRYGNINEIALFEMNEKGMIPVSDYSSIFLNKTEYKQGTVYSMYMEGNKPIFLEIQSLIVDSYSEKNIIQSVGYDLKRLNQMIAIITKEKFNYNSKKITIYNKNIFINITNGMIIKEPFIDLAIFASIISNETNIIIKDSIFIGEIGLNGTVIKHPNEEYIVKESKKYFKNVISYSTGYNNIKKVFDYIINQSLKGK